MSHGMALENFDENPYEEAAETGMFARVDAVFEGMDLDGNGTIEFSELIELIGSEEVRWWCHAASHVKRHPTPCKASRHAMAGTLWRSVAALLLFSSLLFSSEGGSVGVMSCHVMSCHVSCRAMSCRVMCHVVPCRAMSCHVSCHALRCTAHYDVPHAQVATLLLPLLDNIDDDEIITKDEWEGFFVRMGETGLGDQVRRHP